MRRRLWLVALLLYSAAAVADAAARLAAHDAPITADLSPANLAVAVSAGLFWPLDLVARVMLAR